MFKLKDLSATVEMGAMRAYVTSYVNELSILQTFMSACLCVGSYLEIRELVECEGVGNTYFQAGLGIQSEVSTQVVKMDRLIHSANRPPTV